MIYDPTRRALELRQRILESMSAEKQAEYLRGNENQSNAAQRGQVAAEG